jgi:hypothetical protein
MHTHHALDLWCGEAGRQTWEEDFIVASIGGVRGPPKTMPRRILTTNWKRKIRKRMMIYLSVVAVLVVKKTNGFDLYLDLSTVLSLRSNNLGGPEYSDLSCFANEAVCSGSRSP